MRAYKRSFVQARPAPLYPAYNEARRLWDIRGLQSRPNRT
jgi:hypothetical protein